MTSWQRVNLDDLKRSGAARFVLFLDDGGVMNDNRLRRPEWLRLIREFMPARLGGSAEQWGGANAVTFPPLWREMQRRMPEFASHHELQRTLATEWMSAMCARIGVT